MDKATIEEMLVSWEDESLAVGLNLPAYAGTVSWCR
jgi:hypothetical protein